MLRPPTLLPLFVALRRRALPMLAVLVLALVSSACAHYEVLRQSGPPSALQGVNNIAVTYDYSEIAISDKRMSEEQWLETREKDEHRNTYLETKESANTGVVEGLTKKLGGVTVTAGEAAPGGIQATIVYEEWEEGMYAGVVAWPSRITARVVFSVDGQVVDEIRIRTKEDASLYTPAPQQRLRTCGKRVGEHTAEYILNVNK
ncbi:MAG: hypothetical protein R6X02_16115 [Enhygromyxa sp.]